MEQCRQTALLAVLLLAVLQASCTRSTRMPAVPDELDCFATVLGDPAIRAQGDDLTAEFIDELVRASHRELECLRKDGKLNELLPSTFLALSGGGANGAFGAGLVCGWTASGLRPEFTVVTGVSTGALIAPFAFLGPRYDHKLREAFTEVNTSQIIRRRSIWMLIFDDALFDSSPLRNMVEFMVDDEVVQGIADEYARGRLLLVATVNLDSHTSVFWNVTAIAASGDPRARSLIHDVLVASASIPAAFPPVMIDVEAGGKQYQEMHVDGAAKSSVFLFPSTLNFQFRDATIGIQRQRSAYVIRNARLEAQWEDVPRRTSAIVRRSISALLRSQGESDVFRIYVLARREGVDFNFAYIPASFQEESTEPFDPVFMTKLFHLGYDLAAAPGGYPWDKVPPGFDDSPQRLANDGMSPD